MKLKYLLVIIGITVPTLFSFAKKEKKEIFDQGIQMNFGGEVNFQSGIRHQNKKFISNTSPNNHSSVAFNSDSAVHASLDTRCANGWKYGAQLGIMTSTLSNDPAGTDYLDRTYMYVEKNTFGRVEVGSNKSAANTMKVTGGAVAAATGGVNGAWSNYISVDRYEDFELKKQIISGDNFLDSAKLILKEGSLEEGSHERYRKVTYYSPKYNGFQLGISYGPDTENRGVFPFPPFNGKREGRLKDAVAGAIKWQGNVNNGKDYAELAIVGEHAKQQQPSDANGERVYHPVQSLMIGGKYQHGNVSFAASYANHFKSKFEKVDHINNAYLYDVGIGYNFGKANISLTYLHTDKNKNKLNAVSAGADYNLASGVLPYAEVAYVQIHQKRNYKENKENSNRAEIEFTDLKNSGLVYILGAKVTF